MLTQKNWSWTELLGVWHYSVFLGQVDNVTESIFPDFAHDTKQAEEGGRGDIGAIFQRDLDSLPDQANKNCRSLSRDKSCTHNVTMPKAAAAQAAPLQFYNLYTVISNIHW